MYHVNRYWIESEIIMGDKCMTEMNKFTYSRMISQKRSEGKMQEAIRIAIEARDKFPDENIFEKFLGDLYFQNTNYKSAGASYISFLSKLGGDVQYIKHFTNFLHRYVECVSKTEIEEYVIKVQRELDRLEFEPKELISICEIIAPYMRVEKISLFTDDHYFKQAISYIQEIENSYFVYIIHFQILSLEHTEKNKGIDKYVVSSMEKKEQYTEALQLISNVVKYDTDQVAVRTLFRICRKLDDYTAVEEYMKVHQEIKKVENFNVLYELVFYFSKIGAISERDEALRKMEKCGEKSIPIMRTLYNFYLQFGMLDKAAETNSKIVVLKNSFKKDERRGEREKQEEETSLALFNMIRELFEEIEHSRKLISMSELLKGFSHELGQPITNIRYSIQLYQMQMQMGVDTREELGLLFDDILSQTARIKRLLSRFSPIVTEKNEIIEFSVVNQINTIFKEFSSRLSKENVLWSIKADTDFILCGDSIKFDQIFYNLIGNALYAIKERGVQGNIKVHILEKEKSYKILFQDNGTGIEPEYQDKIFEPFFTTKERDKDENGGGEGLGLYIIWNIVRMFDGDIKLDKRFNEGTRFVIEILKKDKER